ncbi:MAG: 2-hydroxyacyl-CoA dehydratase [Dehalococcoidales bacterium]|nr:2-hydroxyacyl-CoA dehydratase [Dehalococcoidales bacterium]
MTAKITKELKGMEKVRVVNQDRTQRVKDLQQEGSKVFGYLCIYPITELLTSFDIVPFRLFGDITEPITKADNYLPTVVCPFLRSYLDLGLKGKYDFLDGVITSHICDVGSGLPGIWYYTVKTGYTYHFDTPHTMRETSQDYHRQLLDSFVHSLEEYSGEKLSKEKLVEAIRLHNTQRSLVRKLYDLKKPDPALISGTETQQVIKAVQSLPVEEGNRLLEEVISETSCRKVSLNKHNKRLMVWGSILDNTSLLEVIEECGATVVIDDTCVGSRPFFNDVALTDNPLDGLAKHYLTHIKCPRTFTADYFATSKDYPADLKMRFGYLGDYARDWKVDGIILEALRFCDTHGYEIPSVKDYFNDLGLPSIYIEHDYTLGTLSQLKTRVQGFLEIIDG